MGKPQFATPVSKNPIYACNTFDVSKNQPDKNVFNAADAPKGLTPQYTSHPNTHMELEEYTVMFDGRPWDRCALPVNNRVDRGSLSVVCIVPSRCISRELYLDCTGGWGAKCTETFADKTKLTRCWSCCIDDSAVRRSINDAFDALESDPDVEWGYPRPESTPYGYLSVSSEHDKGVHAACVAVFAAAGFKY